MVGRCETDEQAQVKKSTVSTYPERTDRGLAEIPGRQPVFDSHYRLYFCGHHQQYYFQRVQNYRYLACIRLYKRGIDLALHGGADHRNDPLCRHWKSNAYADTLLKGIYEKEAEVFRRPDEDELRVTACLNKITDLLKN